MFRNYFKIALRNLRKNKVYAFINVTGLAMGMACALFILAYIKNEMSYDRFHKDRNHIYQVLTHMGIRNNSISPTLLGPKLKEEFPEVVEAARFHWIWGGAMLTYRDQSFNEEKLRFADPPFLSLFNFPFIMGDPKKAFENPNSIVITQAIAEKYFGDEDPIGNVLTLNREYPLTVTGVIENIPANSTLRFDMLVPIEFNMQHLVNFHAYTSWDAITVYTFIRCRDHASIDGLGEKINTLVGKNTKRADYAFSLLPFTERYFFFYSNKTNVYAFLTVAVFILLIACFNFMNLSTARSARRAKEVGMRKIVGALRKQIMFQFLGESVLLSLIAGMFALILFFLLHPLFSDVIGREIHMSYPFILLSTAGVAVMTGLVAGSYPAFVLSNFRLIHALKGHSKSGSKSHGIRKAMVVVQFILSILLIIGMLVVHQQNLFMQNMEVGYQKACVIGIPMGGGSKQFYQTYKNELLKDSGVLGVTGSASALPFFNWTQGSFRWEGKDPNEKISINYNEIDWDFVETLQIDILEGRRFSREYPSDSDHGYLINEEMAHLIGLTPVVGARLDLGDQPGRIVGVIENFHFSTLDNRIGPLALRLRPDVVDNLLVRIRSENITSTVSIIEKTWKDVMPQYPFEYSFLDEEFDESLFSLGRTDNLLSAFSVLAIIISCLGLFGLSSYAAAQRTKEIGIRKVLGASASNIARQISKEFILLVMIANVIVWPAAYFIMGKWLQSFAYRIHIGFWVFVSAGLAALIVSFISVSWQTIKAALANPVECLKYE